MRQPFESVDLSTAQLVQPIAAPVLPGPRRPVNPPEPAEARGAPLRPPEPRRTPGRALSRLIKLVACLDGLVLLAAIALAVPFRGLLADLDPTSVSGLDITLRVAPVLWVGWLVLLFFNGAYAKRTFGGGAEEFQALVKATVLAGLVASTACFLLDSSLSRAWLAGSFLLGGPLLVAERYLVRRWVRGQRAQGGLRHRVLVVGSANAVRALSGVLARAPRLGYEIVGCTLTQPGLPLDGELPARVMGSSHDVMSTCRTLGADTVMVAGGTDLELREVSWSLEGHDVDLIVVPHLSDVSGPRMQMRPVAGLPLIHVEEPQAARAGEWPKRAFDIMGAAAALLVLAPVMLVVAALVRLGDGGPVFYRQARVGLNGERFSCWKFRSMSVNAEKIDAELRSQHGHSEGLFKLQNDPRVTRVGRVLRKYSLDELPQLFNVLGGSMSLVGPRPHLPLEVDTYSPHVRRRLHVRPGMTGLWQVSGRSNLSWDDAVRLDLSYRDNWSMVGDLLIIGKTIRAVVAKDGAY